MKKFLTVLIGLLVMGSLLLTACQPANTNVSDEGQQEEAAASEEEAAVTEEEEVTEAEDEVTDAQEAEEAGDGVAKGGTLNWWIDASVQFDPPFIIDGPSFNVASQIYSFLFRVDADGKVLPDLAESWEYENDGASVVFHLRQGVTFQDGNDVFPEGEGREVVASDVIYSFERYMTIEGGQPSSDLVQLYDSIEEVDDYTVRLNLTQPDALLFVSGRGLTSLGIIPQEAVEYFGDTWNLNPIGSGPFEMYEYIADESVTLVANEDHYITPNLDKVVFKIIPDATVASLALEAGEIDFIQTASTTTFDQFAEMEGFTTVIGTCPWNWYVNFDFMDPLTATYEVRKAFAHSLDGASILQAVLGGLFVGGCGTAGPGVPGWDPDLCESYFAYDPDLAAQTLTDAGWEKNADGVWEKDGEPLSVTFEIWNLDPMPDIASAMLTQWQEFGFDVELVQVEFGTWIDDYYGGNQSNLMFSNGFCGDGGLNSLYGSSGLGYTLGYSNEEAAVMLDGANYIVDPEERDETLRTAQEMVYKDYVALTLGFAAGGEVISDRVHEYEGTGWFLNLVTAEANVWVSE